MIQIIDLYNLLPLVIIAFAATMILMLEVFIKKSENIIFDDFKLFKSIGFHY